MKFKTYAEYMLFLEKLKNTKVTVDVTTKATSEGKSTNDEDLDKQIILER